MDKAQHKRQRRRQAHLRVRGRVAGSAERPRLAVFKSLRYVYAQVIDDSRGKTLAQASSKESAIAKKAEGGTSTKDAARLVGEAIAERAKKQGVEAVVFDRGGYLYHGKVRELAEGARSKGLKF